MPASLAVIGGDASGVDKGTMRLIFGTSGWTISCQGIKRASFPLVFSHLISLILSTTTTTTLSTSQVTNFNQTTIIMSPCSCTCCSGNCNSCACSSCTVCLFSIYLYSILSVSCLCTNTSPALNLSMRYLLPADRSDPLVPYFSQGY